MPETPFTAELPDGTLHHCYSPSSVVRDYFSAGETLTAPEFLARSRQALTEASDRVAAKFGFACTAAASSLHQIESWATQLDPDTTITIRSI